LIRGREERSDGRGFPETPSVHENTPLLSFPPFLQTQNAPHLWLTDPEKTFVAKAPLATAQTAERRAYLHHWIEEKITYKGFASRVKNKEIFS
jgi:hypothetical protein